MRSQHRLTRNRSEPAPLDAHDAADANARNLYVLLADALPGGRKLLGPRQCRRVTVFASGTSAPTAGDWSRLIAAGAPRDAVIAYYLATVDHLRNLPVPDAHLTLATYLRETSEAAAAMLDYERDPSLENLTRATQETLDGQHAGGELARLAFRINHTVREARAVSVRRLTETRPPLPARSDRRIAR